MGKLPTIAWTAVVLANLGLAGCKCCHTCSNGSCSAPSHNTTTHHTSTPSSQPQGLPAMMPPASGEPVSMTPGKPHVTTYKSMPVEGVPATPTSYQNSGQPVRMPVGQVHTVASQPVKAASAMESEDDATETTPAATPRTTTPAIPTITETMMPPGTPMPARPPISH